ncbi:protein shank-like isoform X2 [Macadamia integrifolia]|uniref:protein shank-like isoform X2 n=1 Tax=Macadamia integrifolia TaxID=60698 RepID=UPI001C531C5E|nr:protein shank-like isoform X2 [Macadamia integrifolia]
MVSDQEIASGVESVLRQSDPRGVTSLNGVVQQLEAKLGLSLSHKAGFIRDQIDLLLRSQPQQHPPKDHFALQHHPQYQNNHPQIPQHFALPLHRHEELNFRSAPPPAQPQPPPVTKVDAFVQNVAAPPAPEVPKEGAPTGTKRRGGPGGLNKVCGVSPELQAIVGEPALPRTQIVKQLWAYIRKNNLQDPSNKRKIICNDALRVVFETDCTDMFKMNKLLAKHIIPLEPTKSSRDSKRTKLDVESAVETTEPVVPSVIISDALANFFGTGEREMHQSEAIRRVWEYIKANHLEDPLNSMVILCDSKLQELFGHESVSALVVSEMLTRHFFKRS